ncbi:MAG: ribosomal L7Ae/L30e/S12e/Gadd45 family protein [Clostridia bacterium]|nr:ribosomal L7Ae/L30e/S12e/Gadd45 family protein [Clostridia bacterium]
MLDNKVLGYLGLAKKAGLLADGTESVVTSVRGNKSKLVILAIDASPSTVKKVTDKCSYYKVKLVTAGTMSVLGNALGRELTACVSVNDEKFAEVIGKFVTTN